MIDTSELIDYFENLATLNKSIAHNPDVYEQNAFLYGDLETLLEDISGRNSSNFIMLLETGSGELTGPDEFHLFDSADVAFVICKSVKQDDRMMQRLVERDCKKIGMRIIKRIQRDRDNGEVDFLVDFNLNKVKYMKVYGFGQNHFGYRFQFSIDDSARLAYEANEFTDTSVVVVLPDNTVAPTLSLSGSQLPGTVITLGNGTWAGTTPMTYEYRWLRDNAVIVGETANTYTTLVGDSGKVIKGQVRAINAAGPAVAWVTTSNQVDAVNTAYDADAQAWFDAIEEADETLTLTETQKNAGNAVFVSLKAAGLYNKGYALYLPLVGGTAVANKFNSVNPVDTNAAFRLTFGGGVTHTSGITGNGINGHANTHFNVENESLIDSLCVFMYSRTNENGDKYDIGALTMGGMGVTLRSRLSDFVFASVNQNDPPAAPVNTDSTGFFAVSRINATQEIKNVNGVNTINSRNSIDQPNLDLFLMALNFGGSAFGCTSRNYSAFGIFQGLNADELITMRTIISTYNAAIA